MSETYSAVKSYVMELVDQGFEDLDILVAVNEKFTDKGLVQTVLADLRRNGVL